MNNRSLFKFTAMTLFLLLAGHAARAQAYLTQNINTYALNTASYDDLNGNLGPFPFSNFGVQATDSLGLLVSASVNGQTTFTFPTFTPGQSFAAGTSFNYAYNPSWSGGSVGSSAGLSASASFNYDIAGFTGSHSLFDAGLNASANGNITGGTSLSGGSANGTAVGPTANYGITASAYVASASAGVSVGVNLQTAITYTPTVQYGYYTWVNTNGGYSASDVLTWHGVSSGNLSLDLANTLAAQAGSNTFFVNYAPGVQVDLSVTPTSYINLPVSGYFNAEAFGETIVNQTFPIGTLTAYTANYDTWDDNMNFNGKYYSLELTQSDQCVGYDQSIPACAHFTVDGSGPFLGAQLNFPGGGSSGSLTGGSGNGSWDDTFANSPLLPNFCDTSTNECYASNDPNAPIGNLTVTSNDNPVGAPEPSTAPFLVAGFLTLALFTKKLNV